MKYSSQVMKVADEGKPAQTAAEGMSIDFLISVC